MAQSTDLLPFKFRAETERESVDKVNKKEGGSGSGVKKEVDLGNESRVLYISRFLPSQESFKYLDYLNQHIPWIRPTIRVFGRSCLQVVPISLSLLPTTFIAHVSNLNLFSFGFNLFFFLPFFSIKVIFRHYPSLPP